MGGYNSGGHNRTHKTVENYRRIDSFAFYHHLMGDKYLSCKNNVKYRGTSGNIIYHVQDKTAEIETGGLCVPLKLSRVPGIDGWSIRLYFHCPYCGRRVRYLYDFRSHYVCRHCLNANYKIQQTSGMDKLRKQMENVVVKKLKYDWWRYDNPGASIFELYNIPKPQYMRWEKYAEYLHEYQRLQREYEEQFWCGMFRCGFIPDSVKAEIMSNMSAM